MTPGTGTKARRRRSLAFVVFVLVIDALGVGIMMPVMPELLRDVLGGSLAQAAIWGGILSSSYAAMHFLFAPMVGTLADRFGRRAVILVSLTAIAGNHLVIGLTWSIWLLLGARLIAGIAASARAVASAFILDISARAEKATGLALIGAVPGAGLALGPAIGGWLGQIDTRFPSSRPRGLRQSGLPSAGW